MTAGGGDDARRCAWCGADITQRHQYAAYCDDRCKKLAHGLRARNRLRAKKLAARQGRTCRTCNGDMSHAAPNARYCCAKCRSAFGNFKKSRPMFGPWPSRHCRCCGTEFEGFPAKRTCCSADCQRKAKNQARITARKLSGYKQRYDKAYHLKNYDRELERKRRTARQRRLENPGKYTERQRRKDAQRALSLLLLPTHNPPEVNDGL
jgi:hypothetical protein